MSRTGFPLSERAVMGGAPGESDLPPGSAVRVPGPLFLAVGATPTGVSGTMLLRALPARAGRIPAGMGTSGGCEARHGGPQPGHARPAVFCHGASLARGPGQCG